MALAACGHPSEPASLRVDARAPDALAVPDAPIGVSGFGVPAVAADASNRAAQLAKDHPADAIAALSAALAADPEDADAHRLLASLLVGEGQAGAALPEFGLALGEDLLGTEDAMRHDHGLVDLTTRFPDAIRLLVSHDQAAYAADPVNDVLFVARTQAPRAHGRGSKEHPLDPHQELWAWDLATGRYRRLTETGGHVEGWISAPDRESVLIVGATHLRGEGPAALLSDPSVWRLDLATLDLAGPLVLSASLRVEVGFDTSGRAVAATDGGLVGLDFGALRASAAGGDATGDVLAVWPDGGRIIHHAEGDLTLPGGLLADPATRLRSAGGQVASQELVATCPDPSSAPASGPASAPVPRALGDVFVTPRTGDPVDVATAHGLADLGFIGETRLAIGDGVGKTAALHLVNLATGATTALGPRSGAGLHGITDAPDCPPAPASAPTTTP